MNPVRLPRFTRSAAVVPMQLTERDREIIRQVHRHRFLRSSHVAALTGGSPQQILRRLNLLYHHGFLERPRAQLRYYERANSRKIAYGLGKKAGAWLKREHGIAVHPDSWGEKNDGIGRVFLDHALLVSDFMVAIELACRKEGIRLLYGEDLPLPRKTQALPQPFRWRVNVGRAKSSVVPDRVFALEYEDENGHTNRAYYFLEADRGTMPVVRRNLSQTSFRRKLLAYEATWNQNIHWRRLGFTRFRVLTVTTSAARVNSLVEACSRLKSGHGLFLFADQSILSGDILRASWQTGRAGEAAKITEGRDVRLVGPLEFERPRLGTLRTGQLP